MAKNVILASGEKFSRISTIDSTSICREKMTMNRGFVVGGILMSGFDHADILTLPIGGVVSSGLMDIILFIFGSLVLLVLFLVVEGIITFCSFDLTCNILPFSTLLAQR